MDFRRGSRSAEPEINLIPLIDVVLVIVIFLMLTTTFTKVSGLAINLPTAEPGENAVTANEIVVIVGAGGDVLVNGRAVRERGAAAIGAELGRALRAQAGDMPVVVINADAKASHQSVVDVMQAAQRAGLPNITFATQAPAQ